MGLTKIAKKMRVQNDNCSIRPLNFASNIQQKGTKDEEKHRLTFRTPRGGRKVPNKLFFNQNSNLLTENHLLKSSKLKG